MGFADRMMRTIYGALHETETTFCGVGMREAAKLGEFICRVVYRAVIGKLLSYFFVRCQFVSHQMRLAANRRDDLFA